MACVLEIPKRRMSDISSAVLLVWLEWVDLRSRYHNWHALHGSAKPSSLRGKWSDQNAARLLVLSSRNSSAAQAVRCAALAVETAAEVAASIMQ